MPPHPLPENTLAGDRARRRGARCLLLALVSTPLATWIFLNVGLLWPRIEPLTGMAFALATTAFGAALAIAPVVAAAGWLLALWFGVESVYLPRQRATPPVDRLITGIGLAVWFLPALGFLAAAIHALFSGRVHFVRPPRDYLRALDPIAYWQGVGFLLITAGVFAWLAWRYWQGKLRRPAAGTE
ncbi:MAG: hypothetical protein LBP86_07645 [Azoarcus sp.]|jgi:hypothetical protein|nr:hypothetical protein [Azoarcus sp.]